MIKKITAFSVHTTGEGERVAFTYSIINENGTVVTQNKRAEIVLINQDALNAVNTLYEFLTAKIPE